MCLHRDGPELLLEALELRVEGQSPFPLELLEHERPGPPSALVQAGADRAPLLELQLAQVTQLVRTPIQEPEMPRRPARFQTT